MTILQQRSTKSEYKNIALGDQAGICDVQAALHDAKKKYEDRKAQQSEVRKLLAMFSSRLMYYGGVLDTVRGEELNILIIKLINSI